MSKSQMVIKNTLVNALVGKAKRFFAKPDNVGSWLVDLIEIGYDEGNDGRCNIASENPEEARYAKALSLEEFANAHRKGLIKFLKTDEGKRAFAHALAASYEDLQDDVDEDE